MDWHPRGRHPLPRSTHHAARRTAPHCYPSRPQQRGDRDILVKTFPVDSHTFADQPPATPLLLGRAAQPGKPFEGDADLAAVRKSDMQRLLVESNINREDGSRFNL